MEFRGTFNGKIENILTRTGFPRDFNFLIEFRYARNDEIYRAECLQDTDYCLSDCLK